MRGTKKGRGGGGVSTCPPENPTATTPRSRPFARNLGLIVEGEVIVADARIYERTLQE